MGKSTTNKPIYMGWDELEFINDIQIQRLTLDQQKTIISILLRAFRQPGAPLIPNNDLDLATLGRCVQEQWEEQKDAVLAAGFRSVRGGKFLRHRLLDAAWDRYYEYVQGKSKAGKESAKRRKDGGPVQPGDTVVAPADTDHRLESYVVDWAIQIYGQDKPKVSEKTKTALYSQLKPILNGHPLRYWDVLLMVLCNTDNYYALNPFKNAATQERLVKSLVTNLPKIMADRDYGGVVEAFLKGDLEPMRKTWKGIVVDCGDDDLDWQECDGQVGENDF
jgi:hypothetical protein